MSESKGTTTHLETITTRDEAEYKVHWRTYAAIVSLALANCCAAVTNTTNTIIAYQALSVKNGLAHVSWIANVGFLLTLTCAPIFGSLADRLGKKWFIVGGAILGVIGSFVSSSAVSVGTLIGGNALSGIGTAGCIVAIASIQEVTPNRLRPATFGFGQMLASVFAVLGTFLAAYYAEYKTWAWSYRFNGIVFAVAGLSVLFTYFPPPTAMRRSSELWQSILEVDYFGMLLLAGSLASIVMGLTWGGTTYAWNSGPIIGTLVAGCIGLVLFGLFEWKIKTSNSLLDHRLFQSRNFAILCFVCGIDGMLLLGVNVLYANEIKDLFDAGPVRTAVILSPYLITSTAGCLPAGWLMSYTKSYRIMLVVALLWCSLFTGLMGLINKDRLHWAFAFSTLFGIGTAVTTVIPIVALSLSVPSFILGTAGTLSISARALGGIVGITIFEAVYDNKLAATGNEAQSWKYVWITISCIILAAAIASCFLKSVVKELNNAIESALEHTTIREVQKHMHVDGKLEA